MKNKIRELREELNLTQEDLAKVAGVRRETIVHLERGRYNPSLQLAYRIASHFNKQIEEVFELGLATDKK